MLSPELLLKSPTAQRLYHQYAEQAPVFDYHCHLSARDILLDAEFEDICDMWLKYDHYKWRAMRIAGLDERLITGDASGLEKFRAFAYTVARLVGSPLYHWVYLELKAYFDITEPLDETSADRIYEACNRQIQAKHLRPSDLIAQSNVRLIGTTDDPTDNLDSHRLIAQQQKLNCRVLPTYRPDRILNLTAQDYPEYLSRLAQKAGLSAIDNYETLIKAIRFSLDDFASAGCQMSDHSLEKLLLPPSSPEQADQILRARFSGQLPSEQDLALFRSQLMLVLSSLYKEYGWVMQLHIGALRNNNATMFRSLGADAGFDIMNDFPIAEPLAQFLSALEAKDYLPSTILYSLNSKDNLVLSTLPQCFPDGQTPGKIQFGSAWWFNDTRDGMKAHLQSIAEQNMLPWFVGMLTDSRSFLSYTRHDYFRRILCQFIGERVDNGEFTASEAILRELVEGVCYRNIQRYLKQV